MSSEIESSEESLQVNIVNFNFQSDFSHKLFISVFVLVIITFCVEITVKYLMMEKFVPTKAIFLLNTAATTYEVAAYLRYAIWKIQRPPFNIHYEFIFGVTIPWSPSSHQLIEDET